MNLGHRRRAALHRLLARRIMPMRYRPEDDLGARSGALRCDFPDRRNGVTAHGRAAPCARSVNHHAGLRASRSHANAEAGHGAIPYRELTIAGSKGIHSAFGKLHSSLYDTPFQANRVLAVVGSMYAFAGRAGIVPEGTNPARRIDKFKEGRRERFLTCEELERLGSAIREAETTGIPWVIDASKPTAKHVSKATVPPGSRRRQRRHCGYSFLRGAACEKFCICGGSTSTWSAVVCSCRTAKVAGRLSFLTPRPSRC
jgi:hypothetical protein